MLALQQGGKRSFPPIAWAPGLNDGAPNDQSMFDVHNGAAVIAQIESREGCENIEEIVSVLGSELARLLSLAKAAERLIAAQSMV